MSIKSMRGNLVAKQTRFGIVAGRFNEFIVSQLVAGAIDTLTQHGDVEKDIEVLYVPGAFEMPLVTKKLIETGDYDGVIALGAVIRGSTPHFDFVAGECAKGLANVALECSIPVVNGVLTTNTIEQAIERAGTKAGNKGAEAAMTFMEMVSLLQKI